MDTLADALVEAVMFIAIRDYGESDNVEDFEATDVQELENITGILAAATPAERAALEEAVERALANLPPDSDAAPYYRAWMSNMFNDNTEEES